MIIPTQLCKKLKKDIVVQTNLDDLVVFICATKDSNNKIEHENCVDEKENHLEVFSQGMNGVQIVSCVAFSGINRHVPLS